MGNYTGYFATAILIFYFNKIVPLPPERGGGTSTKEMINIMDFELEKQTMINFHELMDGIGGRFLTLADELQIEISFDRKMVDEKSQRYQRVMAAYNNCLELCAGMDAVLDVLKTEKGCKT